MVRPVEMRPPPEPQYQGLRLSADEYLALEDDGFRYELINGIVIMSPSATFGHGKIAGYIYAELHRHVQMHDLGQVVFEIDVKITEDLVYRPDLLFLSREKAAKIKDRISIAPDLIVEILSPETRVMDRTTKRLDYERFGVREYWMIDQRTLAATALTLKAGTYTEAPITGPKLASIAIPGFELDLAALKKAVQG